MLASGLQVLMLRHQDITMGSAKFIYVFIGTKTHKKGRNRRKLQNCILQFKSRFIYQHIKTNLKIELQKFNSRLSIFTVSRT